jgi:hypothetical protein
MRNFRLLVPLLLAPAQLFAQPAASLSPQVSTFVVEDAPVFVITQVRVVDGRGGPPRFRKRPGSWKSRVTLSFRAW